MYYQRLLIVFIIAFIFIGCSLPNHTIIRTAILNNRPSVSHNPQKDIMSKSTIDPLADETIVLYFALANRMKKYDIEYKLYQPDGKLFYAVKKILNQTNTSYTYYYDWFVFNSLFLLNYPGLWRAELYVDNMISDSQTFKVVDRPELLILKNNFLDKYKYYYVGIDTSDVKGDHKNEVVITRINSFAGKVSPAERAGLSKDDIITEINGKTVFSSSHAVDLFVNPSDPDNLIFKVYRPSINRYLSIKVVPERIINDFKPDAGKAMRDCRDYIKSPEIFAENISKSQETALFLDRKEEGKAPTVTKPNDSEKIREPESQKKVIIKGDKVKIAIIEFQNINEESKKDRLGLMFSEMLTTAFVISEAFKITEREHLQKVAKELELSQSGIIDTSQAKQLGKMVGADAIITGSVTKLGSDLRLDARIIDVQSGIILTAERVIGKIDLHSISSMADRIVDNLVNKFYGDKISHQRGDYNLKSDTVPPSKNAPVFISPTLGATFAHIPSGTFMMGSPNNEFGRYAVESPQHQVTISRSFYMQTTEVTQGQWKKVMGNNPSRFTNCGSDCPVERVSWDDVQEFVRKLNRLEGTDKYRLPTEAEWEYSARAGTTTRYHWGNEIDCSKANYGNDYSSECRGANPGMTMRVGSFSPNPWGLYDMHGNVWEWVQDWQGDYPSGSVIDPKGPSSGSLRVFRGGSWGVKAAFCRSANRFLGVLGSLEVVPGQRGAGLGFRLLMTIPDRK